MPAMERPVTKVSVTVHGKRDFPLHFGKMPDFLVSDLPDLIDNACRLNPATTPDDVIRSIWRLGSRQLRRNLSRGIAATAKENTPPIVQSEEAPATTEEIRQALSEISGASVPEGSVAGSAASGASDT